MNTTPKSGKDDNLGFLHQVVLAEMEGKNAAIHAYDGMIWKIRTGFLTLLFVGWAVLLKSITDSPQRPAESYHSIVWAMFLFSLGLALGAWFVDHTYVRRNFRVILALNELMADVSEASLPATLPQPELLQVARDDPSRRHRCKGYWEGLRDGLCVFFVPILTLAVAAFVVLRPQSAAINQPTGVTTQRSANWQESK